MILEPAARSLRVLLLYTRPPLPMDRGDQQHVAHLIEYLAARGHAVDLVTLVPDGQPMRPDQEAWLRSRCRSVTLVPLTWTDRVLGLITALRDGGPMQVAMFASSSLGHAVRRLLAGNTYDLAYAAYIRAAPALAIAAPHVGRAVLDLNLSQSLNTGRLAREGAGWGVRLFFAVEHRRIRRFEAAVSARASQVVVAGPRDAQAVLEACRLEQRPIPRVLIGPHGVDDRLTAPAHEPPVEPGLVVMTGVMRYLPNVEAALWLAREVWPRVLRAHPRARLAIVGRDPARALRRLHDGRSILVTGRVPSVETWLQRAEVAAVPVRIAAGQQNKLLEALAVGKAVVATSAANEAIGAEPGRHLVLADDAAAFASAVVMLLTDTGRRLELGREARRLVALGWSMEARLARVEAALLADLV